MLTIMEQSADVPQKNIGLVVTVILFIILLFILLAYFVYVFSRIVVSKGNCKVVKIKNGYKIFNEGKYWINPFNSKIVASYKINQNLIEREIYLFKNVDTRLYNKIVIELEYNIVDPIALAKERKNIDTILNHDLDKKLKNILINLDFMKLSNGDEKLLLETLKQLNQTFDYLGVTFIDFLIKKVE